MHIVHSIYREATIAVDKTIGEKNKESELELRYQAYEAACRKYQLEISAIQKYLPNWMPAFNR